MNLLDLFIIFVLALFLLGGMYRGFMSSCYKIISYGLSMILTFIVYPLVAKLLFLSSNLVNSFRFYAEGAEKLVNISDASLPVAELSGEQLAALVEGSIQKTRNGLKVPINNAVLKNMEKQVFNAFSTVGEYYNETIVHIAINMIAFLLVFIVLKLFFNMVINIYENAIPFPVLRQYDALTGGIIGLFEGMMILFVVFSVVPLITSVMTIKPLEDLINGSLLGNFFTKVNFIPYLIRGKV